MPSMINSSSEGTIVERDNGPATDIYMLVKQDPDANRTNKKLRQVIIAYD